MISKSTSRRGNSPPDSQPPLRGFRLRDIGIPTIFLVWGAVTVHLSSIQVNPYIVPHDQPCTGTGTSTGRNSLPIYWINLDVSTTRRDLMMESFSKLGITNTHRVSATNVAEVLRLWHSGYLYFHKNVTLEKMSDDPPAWAKHIYHNTYHYEEAACLMSHFKAIKQAYDAGHDLALIIEDDGMVTSRFHRDWFDYIKQAPMGWKILQFATVNPDVVKHGANLFDPFISWQAYHWATRAYMINRKGMETILEKVHSTTASGRSVWRNVEAPVVVADELIFVAVGDAYTATGLWIDSFDSSKDSAVQASDGSVDRLMLGYNQSVLGDESKQIEMKRQDVMFDESLLVLMNVQIYEEDDIERVIVRVQEDVHAVCMFHKICDWKINLVGADSTLVETAYRRASSQLSDHIHFHMKVISQPLNRFAFFRSYVDAMGKYDLVLLKNFEQRTNGFPWRTFIKKKGSSIVSGPLTQNLDEDMLYRLTEDRKREFHEARRWANPPTAVPLSSSISDTFSNIVQLNVPVVDTHFALFNATFAKYFFSSKMEPSFVDALCDSGPEYLWCKAAFEFDGSRPNCLLIPVVSLREDSLERKIKLKGNDDLIQKLLSNSCTDDLIRKRAMASKSTWAPKIRYQEPYQILQVLQK